MKVASWNLYVGNTWPNVKKGLDALIAAGCEVICMQEVSNDVLWIQMAKHLRDKGWHVTAKNCAIPIAVHRSLKVEAEEYFVVDGTKPTVEAGAGGTVAPHKAYMWVKILADQPVYVLNHHLIASVEKQGVIAAPLRWAFALKQLTAMTKAVTPWVAAGYPVLVAADWNVDADAKAGATLRAVLDSAGLSSAQWVIPGQQDTHDKRAIDDVAYANCDVTALDVLDDFNSDHRAIVVTTTPKPEGGGGTDPEYNDRGLAAADLPERTKEMNMAHAPDEIEAVYDRVIKYLPSMKRGGVYANKAGYHNSYHVLKSVAKWRNNYSVQAKVDQEGDRDGGSGIDLTFGDLDDQITASRRLRRAVDAKDPRVHGKIREWFGSFDGKVVSGDSIYRGTRASADDSHLWHVHISGWRKWNRNKNVWLGVAEVLCGVKAGTFTGSTSVDSGPTRPVPAKPPAHKPLISLKAVQDAIRHGKELAPGVDGAQYQTMLNRFTGSNLTKDGQLGKNTRIVTALAQLKVARANGNKTLDEGDCWPNKGYEPDLDGIPGKELFSKLGIDNADDN